MASTYTGCRSLWVSRVLRSVRTHWTWPEDMERRLLSSSVPKVIADSPLLGMRSSSLVFPTRCCLEAARGGGLGEHFGASSSPPRPWHRNHSLGRCCRLMALCNSQVCYLPADPGFCQRPVPRGLWEGGAWHRLRFREVLQSAHSPRVLGDKLFCAEPELSPAGTVPWGNPDSSGGS
ncbi:Cysteine And Histidine-Rich Protein 1 [Manis pentadactyla]|nr:Cysteine And Histidine-Rich Protein 1 [Manis pentadactyla]